MKDIRDEEASEDARKMRKGEKGVQLKQKAASRDFHGRLEAALDVNKTKKTIEKKDKAQPKAKPNAKTNK